MRVDEGDGRERLREYPPAALGAAALPMRREAFGGGGGMQILVQVTFGCICQV